WNTADIVGVHRFLQRFWRNAVDEETGAIRVSDAPADEETRRVLHRTIAAVRADMAQLQFNTAIARLVELNNRLAAGAAQTGAAGGGGGGGGGPRGRRRHDADAGAAGGTPRRGDVGAPRPRRIARVRGVP